MYTPKTPASIRTTSPLQGSLDLQPGKPVRDLVWAYRALGYGHGPEFWAAFVFTLRSVGYDDVLSIEHEDPLMDAEEAIGRAVMLLIRSPVHFQSSIKKVFISFKCHIIHFEIHDEFQQHGYLTNTRHSETAMRFVSIS